MHKYGTIILDGVDKMILMQLNNIMKSFAGIPILKNINLEVKSNDRIAIVGRNGAGKSTLLKLMTGEMDYDSGNIFQIKDLQIGYLAQHKALSSHLTIWDEMLSLFSDLMKEEKEMMELATTIGENASQGKVDDKIIQEYGKRQEQFEARGGYRYESDIKGVLIGLGFPENQFELTVDDLSGGQKTRLALGKLLLQRPDILILDEPTNHLDIDTLTWLENYLKNYDGALVIVSHDRYFLDKLVSTVYEITYRHIQKYTGTYTQFLHEKSQNYERDLKMYEKQQQEIKMMEDFIQRNIARASTTKRAQSRRKQLEKLDKIDRPLGDEASASFSFQINKSSGNDVLSVNQLSIKHEDSNIPLFSNVSFHMYKGERVALIGKNGVGKTTLLKAIIDKHDQIKLGTNVEIGYYDQEQKHLNEKNTLLEEVWSHFPHKNEQDIRTVLGNFLFSGDDVLKTIHTLSGGEKARVALAKLMLKKANFLILDEPTNHLDLVSKEILEAALLDYEGTILFVSHDRYFINKITDKVIELESTGIIEYLGDYDYYVEKKMEEEERRKLEDSSKERLKTNNTFTENLSFEEQKKRERLARKKEREIIALEKEIEELERLIIDYEEQLIHPDNLHNHEKMYKLTNEIEQIKDKIDELLEKWELLHL